MRISKVVSYSTATEDCLSVMLALFSEPRSVICHGPNLFAVVIGYRITNWVQTRARSIFLDMFIKELVAFVHGWHDFAVHKPENGIANNGSCQVSTYSLWQCHQEKEESRMYSIPYRSNHCQHGSNHRVHTQKRRKWVYFQLKHIGASPQDWQHSAWKISRDFVISTLWT